MQSYFDSFFNRVLQFEFLFAIIKIIKFMGDIVEILEGKINKKIYNKKNNTQKVK